MSCATTLGNRLGRAIVGGAYLLGWVALAGAQTGRISVTVSETGGGGSLPCRAWVDAGGTRYFEPADKTCIPYKRDRSFSCEGRFIIKVPAGQATVHVERGKEYFPVDRVVTVEPGQTTQLAVALERWVDMAAEGWYSADLHVHFGNGRLEVLKRLALADDVNWVPVLSYWNDFKEDWPAWPEGPTVPVDATHLITQNNEEIERIGGAGGTFLSVGAPLMYGLSKPVHVPRHDDTYPGNVVLQRIAKKASPDCVIDTDKPMWGENVAGVALGLFDCVQLCHNHYHRNNTMPACCGMIGDQIEEGLPGWGIDELFIRTNTIHYRWLNCGFKLPVSGGSAMGVMPVPLGYDRMYIRLDGSPNLGNYLKAIHAGRTFATSGPMLSLEVQGRHCGETIVVASGSSQSLHAEARVRSIEPIQLLELIQDGRVVKFAWLSGEAPARVLDRTITTEVLAVRSGWVAARAIFQSPDGHLRQAHTSPIYLSVDNKPTASRRDAQYMIRWLDRLGEVSNQPQRYHSQQDRAEVQAIYREARQVYEQIAHTAAETWGD